MRKQPSHPKRPFHHKAFNVAEAREIAKTATKSVCDKFNETLDELERQQRIVNRRTEGRRNIREELARTRRAFYAQEMRRVRLPDGGAVILPRGTRSGDAVVLGAAVYKVVDDETLVKIQ
jgi:multidrug resistance efflux pump